MSDHTAELARLLRAATPSPAAATPNDQSVGPSLELPADLLADRAALPLVRAIRLRPEQAGAEYGALARLAADRSEDLPTQLSLLRAATALLPRDADLAFRLANKEMEDFDNLFRAEGLRPGESEQTLATAHEEGRASPTVQLNLATALTQVGRHAEAERALRRAAVNMGPLATLATSRKSYAAPSRSRLESWYANWPGAREDTVTLVSGLDKALLHQLRPKAARAVSRFGLAIGLWDQKAQRPPQYTRGLLACAFHRRAHYSGVGVGALEAAAPAIRAEMFELLRRRAEGDADEAALWHEDHERIATAPEKWMRRHVGCSAATWAPGVSGGPAANGTRATCAALEAATRAWWGDGYEDRRLEHVKACFSILMPGAHVAPHVGPHNERIAVSLGLVSSGGAWLRVGSGRRRWTEDEAIVFDDSFEHEVRVEGNEAPRAVLIVHLLHVDLMPRDTPAARARAAGSEMCDVDDGGEPASAGDAVGASAGAGQRDEL